MEAMPDGGVIQAGVGLVSREGEPSVEVSITDQGTGIRAQDLPRLFDPYFTTKANGTGLGLAIAHRIVTDHHGEILIEGAPGAGATVRVRLPVAASAERVGALLGESR
jgi:two-component system sensor histidine kinase AtoS